MKLILIRGLPGAGKSTFAEYIQDAEWLRGYDEGDRTPCDHFENDQYFVNAKGEYKWDPNHVPQAAYWCQLSTKEALGKGHSVIVSNTFTRVWEMQPYIDMAKKFGVELTVMTVEGNHGSVHNVSDEVREKMRRRWEPYDG